MRNLIDYRNEYYLRPPIEMWNARLAAGRGTAKGIDIMLEKLYGKVTGHVSYSLAWTDRTFPDKNGGKDDYHTNDSNDREGDDPNDDDYILKMMTVDMDVKAFVAIKDPKQAVNYYQFSYASFPMEEGSDPEVTVLYPLTFYPGRFRDEDEPIFSEHMGSLEIMTGNSSYGFTFFSDRQFSGKEYALKILFEKARVRIHDQNLSEVPSDFGYMFTLATVSPSYYNWASYRWNSEEGSLNDLSDVGLADPVWGCSNVSTGAGVVAARSLSTVTLSLRAFLQNELDNSRSGKSSASTYLGYN